MKQEVLLQNGMKAEVTEEGVVVEIEDGVSVNVMRDGNSLVVVSNYDMLLGTYTKLPAIKIIPM